MAWGCGILDFNMPTPGECKLAPILSCLSITVDNHDDILV